MEIKWYRWLLLLAALAAAAFFIVGQLTHQSVPEQRQAVPDILKDIEDPRGLGTGVGRYGERVTIKTGQRAVFEDGMTLELLQIEDSRCRKDVVCVWAGELAAVLSVENGDLGKRSVQVRLGELTATSRDVDGYHFKLIKATTGDVTLTVTKG